VLILSCIAELTLKINSIDCRGNPVITAIKAIAHQEIDRRFSYSSIPLANGYVPCEMIACYLDPARRHLMSQHRSVIESELVKQMSIYATHEDLQLNEDYHASNVQLEVTRYYLEKRHDDALAFWKSRAECYPLLHRLACRYFQYPASSASVERVFSISGLVMNSRRHKLSDATFESEVLIRENRSVHAALGIRLT